MKDKFLSRKFLITLIVVGVATALLKDGDLSSVLIASISAYSLGNAGEWFANRDTK